MKKLTPAQTDMLRWLSFADLDVPMPSVAERLRARGFVERLPDDGARASYRITPAGREALAAAEGRADG